MSNDIIWSRRKLLTRALLGGAGGALALEQLGGVRVFDHLFSTAGLDRHVGTLEAYKMLGGAFSGGGSLLRLQRAYAQGNAQNWSVVTIKVANHMYAPLVFAFGRDATVKQGGPGVPNRLVMDLLNPPKDTATNVHFADLNKTRFVAGHPNLAALRFNQWFGDMLQSCTDDGKPTRVASGAGANTHGLMSKGGASPGGAEVEIGDFPHNEVAIQVAFHLQQSVAGQNHAMRGFKIRETVPDLAKFVSDQNIIDSPLGIACFMMGNKYDKAEGSFDTNIVCDGRGENAVMGGRPVRAFVQNMAQSMNGFAEGDAAALTKKFDALVQADGGRLRGQMLETQNHLLSRLASKFEPVMELERHLNNEGPLMTSFRQIAPSHRLDQGTPKQKRDADGNLEKDVAGNPSLVAEPFGSQASSEFLSQCLFTTRMIRTQLSPVRNYSLFLNIADLDTNKLDQIHDGGAGIDGMRPYTYVEGMRQLAMGLNVLAQVMRTHNVMVVVVTEGGRNETLADDKVSFGIVMGPRRAGLQNHVYGNIASLADDNSRVALNHGSSAESSVPWDGKDLMSGSGTPYASADKVLPTTGDLQLGVAEFLASVQGKSYDKRPFGNWVKIRRKGA